MQQIAKKQPLIDLRVLENYDNPTEAGIGQHEFDNKFQGSSQRSHPQKHNLFKAYVLPALIL